MKTKEIVRDQISAFADGELADQHVDATLAALRQAEGRADWEIYHQIGDVLRSEDMAVSLSPGFAASMAARLDAEPTIVAPAVAHARNEERNADAASSSKKRWTLPSIVGAAAVAAVAFITTPQLMVAMKSEPVIGDAVRVVAAPEPAEQAAVVAASVPEGVVLRDPRIDDYLLAHQRFSPSVYSTAQYARSATFSNK